MSNVGAASIGLIASLLAAGFPSRAGQCEWVHGRFAVYQGSGVRRIRVIGTHHVLSLRDDDQRLPTDVARFVALNSDAALFGNFLVCARKPYVEGRMQQVELRAARHLFLHGKPFAAQP